MGSETGVVEFINVVAFNVGVGNDGNVIVVAISVDVVATEDVD